jgi:hypothetical protein
LNPKLVRNNRLGLFSRIFRDCRPCSNNDQQQQNNQQQGWHLTLNQRIRIHILLMIPFQRCSWVSIPGREKSFLHCGEFIVLQEHLTLRDADVDGKSVILHAKVGLILCITSMRNYQSISISLLFLASEFPTAIIREEAAPPYRR